MCFPSYKLAGLTTVKEALKYQAVQNLPPGATQIFKTKLFDVLV